MSDDESEMAKMRQSRNFQSSFHSQQKQGQLKAREDQPSEENAMDVYTRLQYQKEQPEDPFKAPMPPKSSQKQVSKQALLSQQMERRDQLLKDKRLYTDKLLTDEDDGPTVSDLSDINVVKMLKYADDQGGMTFLDDDKESSSVNQRERYKEYLRNEYYEDLRRKEKLLTDGAHIPSDLGKQQKKKISNEEVESIHNKHKRVKLSAEVATRQDFELSREEDDEEMVGPRLDMFDKNEQIQESDERKRKENQITKSVRELADGDSDEEYDSYKMPITHEVVMSGHNKAIQAIDIDQSGSRMVSGSLDYVLKVWDLAGMNRRLKPMREFKPFDGHPIRALSFSPDGAHFLVCCGNNQAKIHDRDGGKVQTTIKGDMYIQDMANTKGHVASLTDGMWHPKEDNIFMTASMDFSIRVWDLQSKLVGVEQQLMHQTVIKVFDQKGHKVTPNSCAYSPNGALIGAGCYDGSIQIWETKTKNLYRPAIHFKSAHAPSNEVTCVKFFKDEKRIVSRSMDDTMKLWDIRNTRDPVFEWRDLTNLSSKTNICISPDEKLVLTGTSVRKGFGYGLMLAYGAQTGELVNKVAISQNSVVTTLWHPALNQIFVGSADADIHALYDPKLSDRGIMNCITKQERKRAIDSTTIFTKPIYTPATYEDEREKEMEKDPFNPNNQNMPSTHIAPEVLDPRLKKDKIRNDPLLTKRPEQPLQGPLGRGGKVSQAGTLTQYIMRHLQKNDQRDADPREVLLAHAKAALEEPLWVTPAYQKTQPKILYDTSEIKREGLKLLESTANKKCAHCGLKFCTCSAK